MDSGRGVLKICMSVMTNEDKARDQTDDCLGSIVLRKFFSFVLYKVYQKTTLM